MTDQCAEYRSSGPVLPEVVRGKAVVVRDWSDQGKTALSSMNTGDIAQIVQLVLKLGRAYWMEKHVRARILNIFSLVASLLAAEEEKHPSRSGRCVVCLSVRQIAGRVMAALVLAMRAPVALSFLAAESSNA